MAYLVYFFGFVGFFSVCAVSETVSPSTESSNSNAAPSVKFSGNYDPLKKPKGPYVRVRSVSALGACELGEAHPVFPAKGKVAS